PMTTDPRNHSGNRPSCPVPLAVALHSGVSRVSSASSACNGREVPLNVRSQHSAASTISATNSADQRATNRIRGVLAPVVTPFDASLAPDGERLLRHCRWLLNQGIGLAVFGTNSEANSLAVDERIALLDPPLQGGVPAARP